MPLHSSRLARSASTPQRCLRWRHAAVRLYSASTNTPESASDPQWFRDLRREMLGRPLVSSAEFVNSDTDKKLELSLSSFLPPGWGRRKPHSRARLFVPLGHSLLWFNNSMPVDQLLPDGTDPLQSPGGPWVRRMWAGGRMEVNRDDYYHRERGFTADTDMVCAERITDVQLRGSGDAEKIFVTLERRFARGDTLDKAKKENAPSQTAPPGSKHFFQEQLLLLRDDWGDAILKEERNLVFFKEKTPAELEAIKSGKFVPVRYLDPPGKSDFSHALTPTRSLLFRYSALTFNAHLIHLDRDYARTVEGHRNLLVHGPLSLTLMLHAISGHILEQTGGKFVVESIKYRNLAPLYCDEEMRLCGLQKDSNEDGATYEVWIEGPTGGVAVKGTVRTMRKPPPGQRLQAVSFRRLPLSAGSQRADVRKPKGSIHKGSTSNHHGVSGVATQPKEEIASITPTSTSYAGQPAEPAEPTQEEIPAADRSEHTSTPVRSYIHRIRGVATSDRRRRNRRRSRKLESPEMATPKISSTLAPPRVTLSTFTLPSAVPVESTDGQATTASNKKARRDRRRARRLNRLARPSPAVATLLPIRKIRIPSPSLVHTVPSRTRPLSDKLGGLRSDHNARAAKHASIVRRYAGSPYAIVLARRSTFERYGPRKIEHVRVRMPERTIGRRSEW